METLDVTKIEPRMKHPTIFTKFDNLTGGEAFIIHNDHDPVPLYYQLIAERGQIFEWEYLLKGPEIFEVKITKLQSGEKSKTIGELVAADFRKAEVFKKFGLDFCCGGHKTLKEACDTKGIHVAEVESAIDEIDRSPRTRQHDFNNWDIAFLSDYIYNTHHKYVRESLPLLEEFSAKVARVHGEHHPEVIEIAERFQAVANELKGHMPKEENILFPYIKMMCEAKRSGSPMTPPGFGSIASPIRVMELEHESAGDNLKRISELSNRYQAPDDACTSYRVLFAKMQEFEEDLHQHIHLENNILFPKAIKLEEELLAN